MAGSLSRAALRALAGRTGPTPQDTDPPRPDGLLIWGHVTSADRLSAFCDLAHRLKPGFPDLQVLATYDPALVDQPAEDLADCDQVLPVPGDDFVLARRFVAQWRPDVVLWCNGPVNHSLIRALASERTAAILLDADLTGFDGYRRGWFRDPLRDTLQHFDHLLVRDTETAALFQRIGVAPDRIEIAGQLRIGPTPPPCPDEDVAEAAAALSARPVWLAAFVNQDEFGSVLIAHRNAVRLAHRLLLVIVLDQQAARDDLLDLLDGMNLRHALWSLGDPIGDNLQVLVASDPEDLGLWYRISSQCFMGSSLSADQGGRSPMGAAALGSAILHGPHVSDHMPAYDRLARAGAAQMVGDGTALGNAVTRLMAPDKAAAMALAGWQVVTEGAELTDKVLTLVQDALETAEGHHASA